MKINRIIIMSILGLMTSTGAFCENTGMSGKTEIGTLCSVVSQCNEIKDSRPFVHFVTTLQPELNTEKGREALTKVYQLIMKEYGNGVNSINSKNLAQMDALLEDAGMTGRCF